MNNLNLIEYNNWYVLRTISKREYLIKNKIDKLFDNYFDILIPLRELLHTKNGNLIEITSPLFPGYIFLYNEINTFMEEMANIKLNQFLKPVYFNNKPAKIKPEEMQYLQSITNEQGIVPLSKGIFYEGDKVKILSGPLKDFKGAIIFINKKKHKAKVRIKIFNREIDVILGLNIIKLY